MKTLQVIMSVGLLCLSPGVSSAIYFTNNYGIGGYYSIGRFEDSGVPAPFRSVIVPSGSGFDARHVAWPSAVDTPDGLYVYASGHNGRRWDGVGLWTSSDGYSISSFQRIGPVLKPSEREPFGISVAHVVYDPDDRTEPFKMWYSIIGRDKMPDRIGLAVSSDGTRWLRAGIVLERKTQYERAGFAVDYVCRSNDGAWLLFYTAYPSIAQSVAAVAVSESASGPYERKGVIMENDGIGTTLAGGARRGTNFVFVSTSSRIEPRAAYLITSGVQRTSEVVTADRIDGDQVLLVAPLSFDHPVGSRFLSIAKRKISPSYARQNPDGSWSGIFTGFGSADRIAAEFTFAVKSRDLMGPWLPDRSQPAPIFRPFLPAHIYSTENPEPVRSNASCVRHED